MVLLFYAASANHQLDMFLIQHTQRSRVVCYYAAAQ